MTTCPLPPFPILPVGGVPAWLLGPSSRRDTSPKPLTPRMSATRCRADRSGFIVDTEAAAHSYDPPATVSGYSRPATESGTRTPNPSQLAAILSPEPLLGLPIGDKRVFPSLTVSAPNSPQNDNLLQNRRDRGDLAAHPLLDRFDALDGLTRQHLQRIEGARHGPWSVVEDRLSSGI